MINTPTSSEGHNECARGTDAAPATCRVTLITLQTVPYLSEHLGRLSPARGIILPVQGKLGGTSDKKNKKRELKKFLYKTPSHFRFDPYDCKREYRGHDPRSLDPTEHSSRMFCGEGNRELL